MLPDLEHRLESVKQKFQLAAVYFCYEDWRLEYLLVELYTFVTDFTKAKLVMLSINNSASMHFLYRGAIYILPICCL